MVGKGKREVSSKGKESGEGSGEKEDFFMPTYATSGKSCIFFSFFIISTNIIRSCVLSKDFNI